MRHSDSRAEGREGGGRKYVFIALLAAAVILVLLLMRGCPADAGPFDYFRAKAAELENDPDRALAFVRDEVATLDYRGDVKGALGALWNGAASPEEKLALLAALWKHCDGGRSGPTLDDIAPGRDKSSDGGAGIAFSMKILHVQGAADTGKKVEIYSGPISALIGNIHSVAVPKAGTTRVDIRAARTAKPVSMELSTGDSTSESLVFEIQRPGGAPLVVERELWHGENRVGPMSAAAGDRHDFVVLPCRVSEYVREKEKLILEEAGRQDAPEARFYDGLLEYAVGSDELLSDIEEEFAVRARFALPRILILSTIGSGDAIAHAMDLRQDYTGFAGDPGDGYCAAHVRGLLESGLEHEWLAQWTGSETRSTFETFNRLRDDYPNRQDRRVDVIYDSLGALNEHGGPGAQAVFRAGGSEGPSVEASLTKEGIRVRGGKVREDFAKALAAREEWKNLTLVNGALDQVFTDGGEAAAAIETVLLGTDGAPSLPTDYVLEADLDAGDETVVVPSARFTFEWGKDEGKVRQSVQVTSVRRGIEYSFHTRRGLRTAAGNLTVERSAVEGATRHNPHYRSGTSTQTNETSFCVSKKVHAELSAGRAIAFELLSQFGRTDDPKAPRPIEWSGKLEPAGPGEIEVQVNGKPAKLPILRAKLVGENAPLDELAILNDPRWPVGRADALTSIQTNVRGRLVDENGIGIGGAFVQAGLTEGSASCITWPDGRFRLPPPKEGDGHGSIRLLVKQKILDDVQEDEVPVDLSAAGLEDIEVEVGRLRHLVMWIAPDQMEKLPELAAGLSMQVRRHVRRHLAANRHVAIPTRMVPDGLVGTVSYYAYDPRTGHIVGVTEDGLHGTMVNWYSYGKAAKKAADAAWAGRADFGAASPLHAMRGANAAMFLFAAYRLSHGSAEEVAMKLLDEMEMWEERTNMFAQVEKAAGGKAREKLAGALGQVSGVGGLDGDSAKASFYAGYIVATAFLHKKVD